MTFIAPFNQWNLAFENFDIAFIPVSEIYIFIKCFSIFGSHVSEKVLNHFKNLNHLFLKSIYFDAFIIMLIYLIPIPWIQVTLFLTQVALVSILDILVLRIINEAIISKKRATFLSIKNTMDAILSIIVIGAMGIISDKSSILWCWFLFSLVSTILMIVLERVRRNIKIS